MEPLERNSRRTRWFHGGVYVLTFVLLFTGWWLFLGREGEPSLLARVTGAGDVTIHTYSGWALAGVGGLAAVVGWRGTRRFWHDSLAYRRSDLQWLSHWPRATLSGRFSRHDGHFDPGQRIANIVMAGTLVLLVLSGIGLVAVSGGPAFVWLLKVHKWSTYVLTPVVVGHVVVTSGVLPGYKGVWRAMHGRGVVHEDVARRLWPAWVEQRLDSTHASDTRDEQD